MDFKELEKELWSRWLSLCGLRGG